MDQNFLTLQFNAETENYAPISALNDLVFCKRRCAYHRLENIWVDSSHTIHGSFLHKKVHAKGRNVKHDRDAFRSLRVLSHKYKLQGICDLVEFVRSQKPSP